MADFKTPNLCGANESLNTALSKIDDIKAEIESKLDSAASEAAAAFESKLTELKSSLDGLAPDLPESKPVNLQSELTSLINDVDRKTAQGIATFNAKVAELKKDFGGALSDKGLDLDKLIDEGTTKLGKDISAATDFLTGTGEGSLTGELTQALGLSGESVNLSSGGGIAGVPGNISEYVAPTATVTGGNLCDLIPNLEIPADVAGTGVTTKEIEDRVSNASTLTLSETPKEILSVQGKKTTQSFFTNIQYKQNGKIIVPSATGTYATIKVTYTVDLIKEKPIAAKQADVPPEKEEVSIITTNTAAKDTSFEGLIAKFKKDIESAPSSKDVSKDIANIQSAFASIGSPEFKAKQEADFATWQTEYKKLKADPLNYKPVVSPKGQTIKATTPQTTITKEVKTDSSGSTYTETKRVTSSDAGFASRQKEKFTEIVRLDKAKEVLSTIDISKYPEEYDFVEETIEFYQAQSSASSIALTDTPWTIQYVSIASNIFYNRKTKVVDPSGVQQYDIPEFDGDDIVQRGAAEGTTGNLFYKLDGQTITFRDAIGRPIDPFTDENIFAVNIGYLTLDKIDPNYKG